VPTGFIAGANESRAEIGPSSPLVVVRRVFLLEGDRPKEKNVGIPLVVEVGAVGEAPDPLSFLAIN
jgi:hypothetical protein